MIKPIAYARELGLSLESATQRNPRLLSGLFAGLVTLVAVLYGALLASGLPFLYLLIAPVGIIGLWLTFTLPEYAALMLLGFRWGFIFDSLDGALRLQSPSLPLAVLLMVVLAAQVVGPQRRRLGFDPILIVLLCYFAHVALGVWYAIYPNLVTTRLSDFSKDILYTLVVAFWLVRPRMMEGAIWLLVVVGALLGTLTVYQEVTQTYDNSYWNLAKVRIAFIIEGVEDRPRAAGPLGDPNFYGQQLLVLLPLALWWAIHPRNVAARLIAIFSALAILAGVGLSYSRGALLAVVVMGAIYFIRFKIRLRYLLYLIPLVLMAVLVAPPEMKARFGTLTEFFGAEDVSQIEDNSFEGRSRYLIVGANMFLDSPIFGKAADHFKALYTDYVLQIGLSPDQDQNRNAHNFYLEVLTEHGLIGLGLLLTMIVMAFRRFMEGQRLYARLGDQRMADLGGFLQVAFAGYAFSAFFLHGDYPRFLWLLLGVAIAFGAGAREAAAEVSEPTPAPGAAPIVPAAS